MTAAPPKKRAAPSALDLVEEAVHLVRRSGFRAFVCYYVGGLPFILALLYFWSDMSRGAFAAERVGQAALTMTLLFAWLKCWHAVFAASLRGNLLGLDPQPWSVRRAARLFATQVALQPSGLIARIVALQFLVPYPWVRAYYENVTALGDGESGDPRATARRARAQALLWPRQNFAALNILFAFGFVVWIDVALFMGFLPSILKTALGVETMFSRSGLSMLNSTFVFTSFGIAHLLVDPFFKSFYVVRCFHGESLLSGEDLRVGLRRAAVAVCAIGLFVAGPCAAAEAPMEKQPERAESVDPVALDRTIEQVLERREFTWRMPPPPADEAKKGPIGRLFSSLADAITSPIKAMIRWVKSLDDKLRELFRKWFPDPEGRDSGESLGWIRSLPTILYILVGIALALTVFLLLRHWKRRPPSDAIAEAVPARPDLASDEVTADQLPEDGWIQLAREMTARGELRLALRALYLAGLAHLGGRGLITIARYKSNREYERELQRRARLDAPLLDAFGRGRSDFERSWYGEHSVTPDSLREFDAILERIRAC